MQNCSTKSLTLCYLGKQNTGSWAENTTILNRLLNCNSDETHEAVHSAICTQKILIYREYLIFKCFNKKFV